MSLRGTTAGAVAMLALAGLGGQRVLAHAASSRVTPSPRCVPARLNVSAVLPGTTLTVSPLPGSYDASPWTQISLLGASPSAIGGMSVKGSRSGAHSGRLEAYSQGDGASFVLSKPLRPGEAVSVHGTQSVGGRVARFAFSFTVAERDPIPHTKPGAKPKVKPGEVQTFHSLPGVVAPTVKVIASSPGQAPGYVFAAPYSGPSQDGPMIFDGAGDLVWFRPLPFGTYAANLQVQRYEEKPVITWWQGYIPREGFGEGEEIVADSSYRTLMRLRAGNGYLADLHDFHLTSQGTALLTAFNPVACDESSVKGPRNGAVTDGVFQEVDLKTRLVRREWHSLDHVALSQSYSPTHGTSLAWPYDYFHINGVERRQGDGFLLSARNTSALYFLDPATGRIALQIGGRSSGVRMGSGAATAYQHDAQELPNGQITIFDNGGKPMVHSQSRAIVVSVDPKARRDTLVAQFEHDKPIEAGSQGNMQLLENGDFFVGWGQEPYFSEFAPSGKVVFDAKLPHATESYRGYRFPWSATPAEPPAIAAGAGAGGLTVYASWNGATNVASWQVLAGASPEQLTPVATAPRSGFETAIAVSGTPGYVAAQALDASGNVLGTSKAIAG